MEEFSSFRNLRESDYYVTRETSLRDTIQCIVGQFELSRAAHITLLCGNLVYMHQYHHYNPSGFSSNDKIIYPPLLYNLHKLEQIMVNPRNLHTHIW